MTEQKIQDRTQVVPFPDATDLQFRVARCFSLLNNWHAGISGRGSMAEVTTILTRQVQARNISLYRFKKGRAGPIAAGVRMFDRREPEHSRGTLAAYLLAHHSGNLRPGSIWRLSKLRQEPEFASSRAAQEWADRTDVLDIALVVLEHGNEHLDAFEMIFDTPPSTHPDFPPSIVTEALADAWMMRSPGVITRIIRQNSHSRARAATPEVVDILGPNNTCGLSRAEQRVIQMLASGEKAKAIAEALELSVATVRTHLRNIYAKTETNGQVELIALLNDRRDIAS